MNELEKIEQEIIDTREHLSDLYLKKRKLQIQDIKIDKQQIYKFLDPNDSSVEYCGMIYNYWKSENEYIFEICGLQKCLSCEFSDSCWCGFDSKYQLYVREGDLTRWLNKLTPISNKEFYTYISDQVQEMKEHLFYWLNTFSDPNFDKNDNED